MGPGKLASTGEREALKHKEELLLKALSAVNAKCANKGGKIKVGKGN